MAQIFEYMDYREFLRDFFEQKKRELRFYSYRLFSQRAGLKSPNFLKLVIMGERNLSKVSVLKFSKALNLSKKEADYFENLIFFNQSKTLEEKNHFLSTLMRYRAAVDPKKIEEAEYEYYSNWYNPIVRELVCTNLFGGDFRKLGSAVIPAISAAEAERSVALLQRLNFIVRNEDGSFRKTAVSLTTGPRVRSVAVANFHRAMMQLASDSLERFAGNERDITSVTLNISTESFPIVIDRLQELRRELLEMAEQDENPERVVQVNLQVFPLSQPVRRKEEQL
jgi:uncharacterized protein (TIGR02147 family)